MTGDTVSLREITADTVRAICNLEVASDQRGFVAPNSVSIAQAHFEPKAWFRAVYAGETPVGFVMLSLYPESAEYYLWRFMIAAEHQGAGYGKQALDLVVAHVRAFPAPPPSLPASFRATAGQANSTAATASWRPARSSTTSSSSRLRSNPAL